MQYKGHSWGRGQGIFSRPKPLKKSRPQPFTFGHKNKDHIGWGKYSYIMEILLNYLGL